MTVIKCRKLRCVGNVAIIDEGMNILKILEVNLKERYLYEVLAVDVRTILDLTLKKYVSIPGIGWLSPG